MTQVVPTKANLECADVILRNNMLYGPSWQGLRRDIAFALTLAEQEAQRKPKRLTSTQKGKGSDG